MFSKGIIDDPTSKIDDARSVIDNSKSIIDDPRSVIDNSRSINDDSRVMLQLVATFTIIIYDHHIFIVQVTGLIYSGCKFCPNRLCSKNFWCINFCYSNLCSVTNYCLLTYVITKSVQ
jgi:hypothetical protein